MPLTVKPLHPVFAAEVTGIDLSQPLTDAAGHMAKLSVSVMLAFSSAFSSFQSKAFSVWSGHAG